MGCKKKKLKVRKYTKGGNLRKFQTGSYLEDTSDMFAPQLNDPTLKGTSNYSTYNSNSESVSSGLGTVASIAGVARQFINGSNNDPNNVKYANNTDSLANTLYNTTPVGSAVNTVLGTVGEAVKTNKNYVNYDEYGHNQVDAGKGIGYEVGSESLDPLTAASDYLDTGEYGKSALAAAGFGWMTGMDDYKKNEAEADAKEAAANFQKMNTINQGKLNQINDNNPQYEFMSRYGGKLRKFQSGGGIQDPKFSGIPVSRPQDIDYSIKIYNEYPYNPRPLTGNSSIDEVVRVLGYDINNVKKDPNTAYNELVKQYPDQYMIGKDSVGTINLIKKEKIPNSIPQQKTVNSPIVRDPNILNSTIQNTNMTIKREGGSLNQDKMLVKKPIVRKYTGQTHEGPNEGIPVDSNGNPSIMTGGKTIGLTEKNEVVYNGYVFSDVIKYKNRNKNKRR